MQRVQKLTSFVLAAVFVVSAASTAWAHCAGWSASVVDRHACCRNGALAPESRVTACCAMSQQSHDTGPIEARVAAIPLTVMRHLAAPFAVAPAAALSGVFTPARVAGRGSHPVPLYLRQAALLI